MKAKITFDNQVLVVSDIVPSKVLRIEILDDNGNKIPKHGFWQDCSSWVSQINDTVLDVLAKKNPPRDSKDL